MFLLIDMCDNGKRMKQLLESALSAVENDDMDDLGFGAGNLGVGIQVTQRNNALIAHVASCPKCAAAYPDYKKR